jgi:pyruvate/2-oxoacid:ferredoxin oxidoreductase beta subunit
MELKTMQLRELFMDNCRIIDDFTKMKYIKDMVDNINNQRVQMKEMKCAINQMSLSMKKNNDKVQSSLSKTRTVIDKSNESIQSIENTFRHIQDAQTEISSLKEGLQRVVQDITDISSISNWCFRLDRQNLAKFFVICRIFHKIF